ncbi:MAG: class I SAM-dependent methyltransferase [Bacteroidota bacterium]
MSYDHKTAYHYAAYRPPLHQYILAIALGRVPKYKKALDIGCGTGVSSEALLPYAQIIEGLDPSSEMIQKAKEHPNISYQVGDSQQMPFSDQSFDLITMAGSLHYAKSQALIEEISRLSHSGAVCLIYDFEVVLWPFLNTLGINKAALSENRAYNHSIDWSGLDLQDWNLKQKYQNQLFLELDEEKLAHLVLADQEMYAATSEICETDDPFLGFIKKLKQIYSEETHEIPTNIFYTLYEQN